MKRRKFDFLLLVCGLLSSFGVADEAKIYQTGTIISVERQEPANTFVRKTTDAPLRSPLWAYRVSVQIGSMVYVGYYETEIDYFPATWTPSHAVEVRIEKKQIYLRTPSGEEVRMQIVSRHRRPPSTGG